MMAERRRSPRHLVQDVRGVLVLRVGAKIVNISLTGAALELTAPIRVGQVYTLKLRGRGQTVQLQGRVVWCQPVTAPRDAGGGESAGTFHAGVHFDGVLDSRGEQLLDVFHESIVVSFGQRLCARFRLETPHPVDLAAEYEFDVRKLSRTGMLIETDLATDLDSVCEFEVELNGDAFRARGRVAHLIAHPPGAGDSPRGRYQLGLEFLDLPTGDRQSLDRFLGDRDPTAGAAGA